MDKASIIKDAIDYIQELHEQERRIQADIMELEGGRMSSSGNSNYHPVGGELYGVDFDPDLQLYLRSKKKRTDLGYDCGGGSRTSPIEDLEVSPLHPPPPPSHLKQAKKSAQNDSTTPGCDERLSACPDHECNLTWYRKISRVPLYTVTP